MFLTGSAGFSRTSSPNRTIGRIINLMVSEVAELLDITVVVAEALAHRVAAELFKGGLDQNQRHHGLPDDPRRWNRTSVRALVLRREWLLGDHVDGLKRFL